MAQRENVGLRGSVLGVTQHGREKKGKGEDKNRLVAFGRNLKYLRARVFLSKTLGNYLKSGGILCNGLRESANETNPQDVTQKLKRPSELNEIN